MGTQNVTEGSLEIVQAQTRKGESAPEVPSRPGNGGILPTAPCRLQWLALAQKHVALTNRAVDGPSMAWLELLLNQSCHMGPTGSGSLPGNDCWPASRARMQHAE